MILRYFATLREVTGKKEETWPEPVEDLAGLIESLTRKYGSQFAKWVSPGDDGFGSLCIILVNGQDYRSLDGAGTRLNPNDTISFFPPIAGG
mgnify:CR=1 FL=1|jgi:molybdopterin synthase sulfur carrier subunit